MAQRRMLSRQITETDIFMDLPLSSQALYLHLVMNADDDGFLANAKVICRMVGASNDDFKLLVAKEYVIVFEDGITVITDWNAQNKVQKDRYHETRYLDHKRQLEINESLSYQRLSDMDTDCIQNVSKMETEVSLGKGSLGKVRQGEKKNSASNGSNVTSNAPTANPQNQGQVPKPNKYGQYQNVLLTNEQLETLKKELPKDWAKWIDKLSNYIQSSGKKYNDHLATIRNWVKRDYDENHPKQKTREDWFGEGDEHETTDKGLPW